MRDDHLTFLVLAGAVTLLAFTTGAVPAMLLPPVLPTSRPEWAAARKGRRSKPGVSKYHLGASDALAAQERTRKAAIRRIAVTLALGIIAVWLYAWVPVEAPPPQEPPFVILDGDRFPLGRE